LNLDYSRKIDEVPNPDKLQKELDELKKIKFSSDFIDYNTFKDFLDKPLGIL
jgi:hypothetical protein